jgi:hypothetical protein
MLNQYADFADFADEETGTSSHLSPGRKENRDFNTNFFACFAASRAEAGAVVFETVNGCIDQPSAFWAAASTSSYLGSSPLTAM